MKAAEVSQAHSRRVYDDGLAAVGDAHHPCHHLVRWQQDNGFSPFQLPEPFSGVRSTLGLAFVGLNPSATRDEQISCHTPDMMFDIYDSFYRGRFSEANRDARGRLVVRKHDGTAKVPRFWRRIELFGRKHLLSLCDDPFSLGEHAILVEAIHFKTARGWLGNAAAQRRVVAHHRPFLDSLLSDSGFRVLVPTGNLAWRQLRDLLRFDNAVPQRISQAHGRLFRARTEAGASLIVCPTLHFSSAVSHQDLARLGVTVREAIQL